jgi:hypothetical protein
MKAINAEKLNQNGSAMWKYQASMSMVSKMWRMAMKPKAYGENLRNIGDGEEMAKIAIWR